MDDDKVRVGDIVQIFNQCSCPMCKSHDTGVIVSVYGRSATVKFMSLLLTNHVEALSIADLRVIGRIDHE